MLDPRDDHGPAVSVQRADYCAPAFWIDTVDLTFDLEPDDQIIPAGKRIAVMIMSSDRDFTLWPAAGTELTVDLDHTSVTIPVVGGKKALDRALKPAH